MAFTQLAGQMLALRRAAPLLRRAPPPPRRLRPAALAGALGSDRQRWGLGAAKALGGVPGLGAVGAQTAEAAALRELNEETGVTSGLAEIIAVSRGWHQYDVPPEMAKLAWGGRYKGQRQKWYVIRFHGHDSDIDIATAKPEFSEWRWVELELLPSLAISFKKVIYQSISEEFAALANTLRANNF